MDMEEVPNINPNQTDRVIARAVDEASGEADDNLIRLSTGVILKAKQANPSTLIRVMTMQKRPTPPMYFDKSMGREMENPNDPDYISRVQAWQMDYSNGMLNVLIGLGTELVSKPDDMEGPLPKKELRPKTGVDGKVIYEEIDIPLSWLADYKALGLPVIADSPSWLYITWIMFVAAPTDKDLNLISDKVKVLSGVREADVRDAETFPKSN